MARAGNAAREIVVGVSGGSGALLARRFVEIALASEGLARLHLILTNPALDVARSELGGRIATPEDWIATLGAPAANIKAPAAGKPAAGRAASRIVLHDNGNVGAPIASGSYPFSGMIVIPCSGGTLGSIAHGVSRDLLQRAADVCLKERRTLVLAFRESPYSLVHVENMRAATLAGAIVAPPTPAFYIDAPSVDRLLDAYCVRAARMLGLSPRGEQFRWMGSGPGPAAPETRKSSGSRKPAARRSRR